MVYTMIQNTIHIYRERDRERGVEREREPTMDKELF